MSQTHSIQRNMLSGITPQEYSVPYGSGFTGTAQALESGINRQVNSRPLDNIIAKPGRPPFANSTTTISGLKTTAAQPLTAAAFSLNSSCMKLRHTAASVFPSPTFSTTPSVDSEGCKMIRKRLRDVSCKAGIFSHGRTAQAPIRVSLARLTCAAPSIFPASCHKE